MNNREFFQQCWKAELTPTLTAINTLKPAANLDYKPSPKNRSAKELVDHFVSHVEDLIEAVESGVLNHRITANYPSLEKAADVFEKSTNKLALLLDKVDEKTWDEKIIPMMIFGNKIGEYPLSKVCWMFMHDLIHHRGQLSTYYRSMSLVQPNIYGPTAEMMAQMMAQPAKAN